MAKSLVLGNGKMLISLDAKGQVKDFYYPYVAFENHVGAYFVHRIGVFAKGRLVWFDNPEWRISVKYNKDTFASDIKAKNDSLEIELSFRDLVYNEKDIFLRRVSVKNLGKGQSEIKIFFNQQFKISESETATTALYDPETFSLIHYKGRRVFLVGGEHRGKPFDDYAVGLLGVEGKEGTWRDAEDGILSKNAIEHGSVDSMLGFTVSLSGGDSRHLTYWIAIGETVGEARALQEYLVEKSPDHLLETTCDYWKAWVNKMSFSFYGLSEKVIDLFKISLFVVRLHADNNGAILATGDSHSFQYGRDTYCYMWPRDAAFSALALEEAGYLDVVRRFLSFCNEIITERGYLMHKYRPDRALGSSWHPWVKDGKPRLPIQEDETAVVLWLFWRYYEHSKDLEFVESLYNSFIKRSADFLLVYRNEKTGLPLSSYDIWEEKYGVSVYTAASVYGALRAAEKFAELLGKESDKESYKTGAESLRRAMLSDIPNPSNRYFRKMMKLENSSFTDDTVDISSFFGPFRFGLMPPEDKLLRDAYEVARTELTPKTSMGGVARYLGDKYNYAGVYPGNPWFITTFWLAQYDIQIAEKEADLKKVKDTLEWAVSCSSESGMMSEQIDPATGLGLSVSPLTWSHAEYIITVIEYLKKLQDLGICKTCYVR